MSHWLYLFLLKSNCNYIQISKKNFCNLRYISLQNSTNFWKKNTIWNTFGGRVKNACNIAEYKSLFFSSYSFWRNSNISIQSGTRRRSNRSNRKYRCLWKPSLHVYPAKKEAGPATLSLPPSHPSCRFRHRLSGCRVLAIQLAWVKRLLLPPLLSSLSAEATHSTFSGKK